MLDFNNGNEFYAVTFFTNTINGRVNNRTNKFATFIKADIFL